MSTQAPGSDFTGTDHGDITATQSWQALAAHQPHVYAMHLREVFAIDPGRGRELTVDVGDLHIDYSKHRVTRETLELLMSLAREVGLEESRDDMFAGAHINTSEDRASCTPPSDSPPRTRR